MSCLSRDEDGKNTATDFKTYWRRYLPVRSQHYNANVTAILRKISHITAGQGLNQDSDTILFYGL